MQPVDVENKEFDSQNGNTFAFSSQIFPDRLQGKNRFPGTY